MFESILVPVDGSSPSSNALNVAIDLAKKCEAKLSIVHAIHQDVSIQDVSIEALREVADRFGFLDQVTEDLSNPDVITPVATPATGVPIVIIPDAVLEKIGNLLLEKSASRARSQSLDTVAIGLLDESPAGAILRYAKINNIDLIVTGSRGMGGLKGLFLGSVSLKLTEDAKCPCLVVK